VPLNISAIPERWQMSIMFAFRDGSRSAAGGSCTSSQAQQGHTGIISLRYSGRLFSGLPITIATTSRTASYSE
jgi:hypothetical protein